MPIGRSKPAAPLAWPSEEKAASGKDGKEKRSSILSGLKSMSWLTRSSTPNTASQSVSGNPRNLAAGHSPQRSNTISQPFLQSTSNIAIKQPDMKRGVVAPPAQPSTRHQDRERAAKEREQVAMRQRERRQELERIYRNGAASASTSAVSSRRRAASPSPEPPPPSSSMSRRRPSSPPPSATYAPQTPPKSPTTLRSALKHSAVPPSPSLSSIAPFNRIAVDYSTMPPFELQLLSFKPERGAYSRQTLVALETSSLTIRTTLDTLLARPSHLASYLLQLCPNPPSSLDNQGGQTKIHVFLDRPSTPYPHILSYLRSHLASAQAGEAPQPRLPRSLALPSHANTASLVGMTKLETLLDVRDEARWLGLQELESLCESELRAAGLYPLKTVTIQESTTGQRESTSSSAITSRSTSSSNSTGVTIPSPNPHPRSVARSQSARSPPTAASAQHSRALYAVPASPTSPTFPSMLSTPPMSPMTPEDERAYRERKKLSEALRLRGTATTPVDRADIRSVSSAGSGGGWI